MVTLPALGDFANISYVQVLYLRYAMKHVCTRIIGALPCYDRLNTVSLRYFEQKKEQKKKKKKKKERVQIISKWRKPLLDHNKQPI